MSSFAQFFTPGAWGYEAVYVALIILFSFFYTAVVFNPVEVAENLKKNGGFIPSFGQGLRLLTTCTVFSIDLLFGARSTSQPCA